MPKFKFDEVKEFLIICVVLGFIFSFRDWGETTFNIGAGIRNFLLTTFLVVVSVLVHEVVQRSYGARFGVSIKFKTWKLLTVAALVTTIITNGYVPFAAIWTMMTVYDSSHRFLFRPGKETPHFGPYERAKVALSGPLANLMLFLIAAYFNYRNPVFVWEKLMMVNAGIAIFNLFPFFRLLPAILFTRTRTLYQFTYKAGKVMQLKRETIPYLEGEILFFGSRPLWIFSFTLALTAISTIYYFKNLLVGAAISIVVAVVIYIIWQWFIEPWSYVYARQSWKPYK